MAACGLAILCHLHAGACPDMLAWLAGQRIYRAGGGMQTCRAALSGSCAHGRAACAAHGVPWTVLGSSSLQLGQREGQLLPGEQQRVSGAAYGVEVHQTHLLSRSASY